MAPNFDKEINVCSLQCPGPILKVREALNLLNVGQVLKVIANDTGFFKDLPSWCTSTKNSLIGIKKDGVVIEAFVRKGEHCCTTEEVIPCKKGKDSSFATDTKKSTIVLFSNDMDKAMAAMIIATGFASLGHNVSIFYTFWGLNVLRKESPPSVKKDLLSRMFGFMMPRGAGKLTLSKMHMMGMGTAMMKHVMKNKNVGSLPNLMKQAQEMGVKFLACDMAMNVMGIKPEELIDGVEIAGVANFAALSEQSSTTLFI
jgi:peroxiredoxin family protein/TusA-related sulfurtransferase